MNPQTLRRVASLVTLTAQLIFASFAVTVNGNTIPVSQSKSDDSYISVLGRVNIGTVLYEKGSHRLFGTITNIGDGTVEVLLAASLETRGGKVSGKTQWFSRSYITSNFEMKK